MVGAHDRCRRRVLAVVVLLMFVDSTHPPRPGGFHTPLSPLPGRPAEPAAFRRPMRG